MRSSLLAAFSGTLVLEQTRNISPSADWRRAQRRTWLYQSPAQPSTGLPLVGRVDYSWITRYRRTSICLAMGRILDSGELHRMGARDADIDDLIETLGRCRTKRSIMQIGVISLLAPVPRILDRLAEHGWCQREGNGYRFRHYGPRIVDLINSQDYLIQEGLKGNTNVLPDFMLHALGFDEIYSLDVGPHDQPTHIHDLNEPDVWKKVGRQFDVLTEYGTLEHVFHVPNALWNIAKMCAVGGEIIHGAPMNNWPNHGFYQFSPTLYFDFYESNGFEVVESSILQMHAPPSTLRFKSKYRRELSFGSPIPKDGHYYNFWCRVRKVREQSEMRSPFQGAYAAIDTWRPNQS